MRRFTAAAGAIFLIALAVPGLAGARARYHWCRPARAGTTYIYVLRTMSCRQARTLERDALQRPVLRNGPNRTGAWWSALNQRWQTAARGERTTGAFQGTWEYGIWSARRGADSCPTLWFWVKRSL